jgi:AraC family transcriptional activator of pobA
MSDLAVDTLRGGASVQVVPLDGFRTDTVRDPHRHDYHELIWIRAGRGRHLIDGEPLPVVEGTITVIGRGQVHQFQKAEDVSGAVVRFGDEVLFGEGTPGWLVTARGGRRVHVPRGEQERLDALIASLAAETSRPPDGRSAELERHLLSVILLWTERWYDAMRTERRDADDAEVQLQRRFARQLEQDFTRHHGEPPMAYRARVRGKSMDR